MKTMASNDDYNDDVVVASAVASADVVRYVAVNGVASCIPVVC